tara:strand:+ start:418 stop:1725 length:1308 start_codon:yes stop_codon:yes gene_type:complete
MKRFHIVLSLLLLLPFCTVGDEATPNDSAIEEAESNNDTSEKETKTEDSEKETKTEDSQSKPSEGESDKISNIRDKCELFANSKEIESDEYFFILGDDIDERQRESKYSHPSGAQNGPFQTWTFEDAVRISSEIIPEEFDKINPFENDDGITWEQFEAFADALCYASENGKGLRNVTITHADLMGRSNEILGFAGNWENFPYIETGNEIIESPSPPGLEFYTKYTTVSGVIIVSGSGVSDEAVLSARRSLEYQLSARPDFHQILQDNNVRVSLFGPDGDTSELPEYKDTSEFGGFAMMSIDASMTANAGWLCYEGNRDEDGDPVIHEMAHTLNHIVFESTNEIYFYENIYKLAEEALENGDWEEGAQALADGVPLSDMIGEFFAINSEDFIISSNSDLKYGTRDNIKKYNPAMYELFARYYPTEPWSYCNDGVER